MFTARVTHERMGGHLRSLRETALWRHCCSDSRCFAGLLAWLRFLLLGGSLRGVTFYVDSTSLLENLFDLLV